MRSKKRLLAGVLASATLAAALTGCGGAASSSAAPSTSGSATGASTEMPTVIVNYMLGTIPSDQALVEEKVNELTTGKIGVKVQLNPIVASSYQQQMNLVMAGSEQVDLALVIGSDLSAYVSKGALLPLDDLLASEGTGITEVLGEYIEAGSVGGEIYQVPANRVMAQQYGIVMRKDLVEKYGIDVSAIHTEADLDEVFAKVKAGEPDMYMVNPQSTTGMAIETWDRLGDSFGALMDYGQNTDVVNLFATDEYRQGVELHRSWYEKGYISPDVLTSSDTSSDLIRSGKLFSAFNPYKPGIEQEVGNQCGCEVVAVGLMDPLAYTSKVNGYGWGIMRNSADPQAAMKVLELMYTDADFVNLLDWGVEGVHYKATGEGDVITFADGVDASTSGYFHNMTFMFGNQFLAHVWEGNPTDVWAQTEAFNQGAKKSLALGFAFDAAPVKAEYTAVKSVYEKYHAALTTGSVDPATELPKFLSELESAGLQKIIDEKQAQLDAWLAR